MNGLLADPAVSRALAREGYAVVPFLDARAVRDVRALHDSIFPEVAFDFQSSILTATAAQQAAVVAGLRAGIGGTLKAMLPGHRMPLAGFMTKRPASRRGQLPLHQDMWITDQRAAFAPNVWCPLVDVGRDTGCLRIVPGSHRLVADPCPMNAYAAGSGLAYDYAADPLEDEFVRDVPVPAGWAVVYDGRIVHGSGENESDRARVAFNCVMIPENAAPTVYWWEAGPPPRLETFEVADSFLWGFRYDRRPADPASPSVRQIDVSQAPPGAFRIDRDRLRRLQADTAGV